MRFNKLVKLLPLLLASSLTACGGISTKPALYDASAIKNVQSWNIGFLYEGGFTEESNSQEKGSAARVVKEGQSPIANKLRDDIVFELKNQHFDVDRTKRDGAGDVRLFPISSGYGGFRSVDIEFALPNGKVAGRIQIKNNELKSDAIDNEFFTESVVDVIATTLKKDAIPEPKRNSEPNFLQRIFSPLQTPPVVTDKK